MDTPMTRITVEQGKRGGRPCIRGMRIAVSDVLGWLAAGMTTEQILADFDELEPEDISASLDYARQAVDRTAPPIAA
jgi:uncharacterized protein (DUF433 family)